MMVPNKLDTPQLIKIQRVRRLLGRSEEKTLDELQKKWGLLARGERIRTLDFLLYYELPTVSSESTCTPAPPSPESNPN